VNSSGSDEGSEVESYEHCDEHSGSIEAEESFDKLNDYSLFKDTPHGINYPNIAVESSNYKHMSRIRKCTFHIHIKCYFSVLTLLLSACRGGNEESNKIPNCVRQSSGGIRRHDTVLKLSHQGVRSHLWSILERPMKTT
jgi:hypothetical protein